MTREKKDSDWDALQRLLESETGETSSKIAPETVAPAVDSSEAEATDAPSATSSSEKKTKKSVAKAAKEKTADSKKSKPARTVKKAPAPRLAAEATIALALDSEPSLKTLDVSALAAESLAEEQNAAKAAPKRRRRPRPVAEEEAREEKKVFGDILAQVTSVAQGRKSKKKAPRVSPKEEATPVQEETPVEAPASDPNSEDFWKDSKSEVEEELLKDILGFSAAEKDASTPNVDPEPAVAEAPEEAVDREESDREARTSDDDLGDFWGEAETLDISWGSAPSKSRFVETRDLTETANPRKVDSFEKADEGVVEEKEEPVVARANEAPEVKELDFNDPSDVEEFFSFSSPDDLGFSPKKSSFVRSSDEGEKATKRAASERYFDDEKEYSEPVSRSSRGGASVERGRSRGARDFEYEEPRRREFENEESQPSRSRRRRRDEREETRVRRVAEPVDSAEETRSERKPERLLPSWDDAVGYVVNFNLSRRLNGGSGKRSV